MSGPAPIQDATTARTALNGHGGTGGGAAGNGGLPAAPPAAVIKRESAGGGGIGLGVGSPDGGEGGEEDDGEPMEVRARAAGEKGCELQVAARVVDAAQNNDGRACKASQHVSKVDPYG